MNKLPLALLCLAPALAARADVKMPAIFGDHMVLQQDVTLPVYGTADPGEKVTVAIAGRSASAVADPAGKWTVRLDPVPVTREGVELTVAGANRLVFTDVLVGDVWICSGQSNMEFGVGAAYNAPAALAAANNPQIRLFVVSHRTALSPQVDVEGKWAVCTPENLGRGGWNGFSAVGYYFGKEIQETRRIPVGLIGTHWGGTPAQAWTSIEALRANPALGRHVQRFDQALSQPAEHVDTQTPSVLFNAMIAPLIPYAIKGVAWYQGESNGDRDSDALEYPAVFSTMINDWRARWGLGDFPFLFVQLSAFPPGKSWPIVRDGQRQTLVLPNTGMAVSLDIGYDKDAHPRDKSDVGHRLALVARHVAYGEKLVDSGPIFARAEKDGNRLRVTFTSVGGGLIIGSAPTGRPEVAPDAPLDHLEGFEIAGADGRYVPAKAQIDGTSVIVSADDVPAPESVRYGWQAYPRVNLYNKEGLPAGPFTSKAP